MRVVAYGKPRQAEPAAVAEGFRSLGHSVTWRNHGYWDEGDFDAYADAVVTFGQRLWSARIADAYRAAGVPVLTVDLPPLRTDGFAEYRALWLDHVNWLPGHRCPCDRLERLHLDFKPHREDGRGVLLCGQCADDAAHGMDATDLRQWAQATAEAIGEFDSVTWRPHPRDQFSLDGFEASDSSVPFGDVLEQDWRAVATFNSTCGLTALVEGVPVVCDSSCFYGEVANTSLSALGEPHWPLLGDRVEFFCRVAYSQWKFDELRSGEAVHFVLNEIARDGGMRWP